MEILDFKNIAFFKVIELSQGLLYLDGRNSQNTFIKTRPTFKL